MALRQRFLRLLAPLSVLVASLGIFPAGADQSAVILIYHRFGEDSVPATNVTEDQFRSHVSELKAGGYNVLPLDEVVTRLRARQELPARSVAITVDDAYTSFQTLGWPVLKEAGFPVTLFVSTDMTDNPGQGYLGWDAVRALRAEGVAIGHHGAAHLHSVHAGVNEVRADIARASSRFQQELGSVPPVFAYPYGEYDLALRKVVQQAGFKAALAQFSGVAGMGSDPFALPRFPFNQNYSGLDRFKLIVNAQALPVSEMVPAEPVLAADRNPPLFGFTLERPVPGLKALSCYPSHMSEPAKVTVIGEQRVEVRFDKPFPPGRSRINCTMPGPDRRWYWLGQFFMVMGGTLD